MGEKEAEKKEGEKKSGDGGAGPVTVVLKVDLHCEGCAQKIKKNLKHLEGVESVKADYASNKLTVVGKVDPTIVKERVEQKTKKKVELVSPQPAKKDGGGDKKPDEKSEKKPDEKAEKKSDDSKKAEEKKPKEIPVTTVVLKTRVHCDGCAHKMKKIVKKHEGVQDVNVDISKDQITIKGTMDMKEMLPYLNAKLKRVVEIVPPPAKKDDGDKKAKESGGGGDGGEKKGKEDAKPAAGGGDGGSKPPEDNVAVVNKLEHYGYPFEFGHYTYNPQQVHENGYVAQYWHAPPMMYAQHNMHAPPYMQPPGYMHAPQMFSDENPNACSIM